MASIPTSAPDSIRRIGIFGGTFDPPHIGHVLTGQRVAEARGLDEVLFVVANDPWQKTGTRYITPAQVRVRMVEQACYWSRSSKTVLKPCEVEILAGGPSYTADTVRRLAQERPNDSFEVIVGSDAATQLHTWKEDEWLASNVNFVAVQRGGQQSAPSPGFSVEFVEAPLLEVSSSSIRDRVAEGLSVGHLCPQPVIGLIHGYQLYRQDSA